MLSKQIAQDVTNRIIAALEQGCAPWIKPWKDGGDNTRPHNLSTKKPYRGINVLLLTVAGMSYGANAWLTYKQAKALGGHVRKGEKGTQIVFWKQLTVADKNADGEEIEKQIPMMRFYTVFNAEQCEGLPVEEKPADDSTFSPIEAAEDLIGKSGAIIRHSGDMAYYNPTGDFIGLPQKKQFRDEPNYYATALHELVHWTGHTARLGREYGKRFGDEAYAREELVAEMGAAFLCAEIGIEGELHHDGYIEHWLKVLKRDERAIFTAASHAQRAADLVLDYAEQEDEAIAA